MKKRIAWPLLAIMAIIVLLNCFLTLTDFGPKVALACNGEMCWAKICTIGDKTCIVCIQMDGKIPCECGLVDCNPY